MLSDELRVAPVEPRQVPTALDHLLAVFHFKAGGGEIVHVGLYPELLDETPDSASSRMGRDHCPRQEHPKTEPGELGPQLTPERAHFLGQRVDDDVPVAIPPALPWAENSLLAFVEQGLSLAREVVEASPALSPGAKPALALHPREG